MAKKQTSDNEFNIPREPDEYSHGSEEFLYSKETGASAREEAPTGHEFEPPADHSGAHRKRSQKSQKNKKAFLNAKGRFIMQMAAAAMAVVIVKDGFGYDLLRHDIFNDSGSSYSEHSISISYASPSSVDDDKKKDDKKKDDDKKDDKRKDTEPDDKYPRDVADKAFPKLSNLNPSGYAEGYGQIDEQYVAYYDDMGYPTWLYCIDGKWNTTYGYQIDAKGLLLEDGTYTKDYEFYADRNALSYDEVAAKLNGRAGGYCIDDQGILIYYDATPYAIVEKHNPIGPIPGASYDLATNTLTLENFTGRQINVNMMGNGFKIKLVGDNYLEQILVWGFGYGGSVTFTGDGSLTLYNSGGKALVLEAEDSESCIMIDKGVSLDIYGDYGAVWVSRTTAAKGLYYLEPLVMETDPAYVPMRRFGPFAAQVNGDEHTYSIVDISNDANDGYYSPVVHVWFGTKED